MGAHQGLPRLPQPCVQARQRARGPTAAAAPVHRRDNRNSSRRRTAAPSRTKTSWTLLRSARWMPGRGGGDDEESRASRGRWPKAAGRPFCSRWPLGEGIRGGGAAAQSQDTHAGVPARLAQPFPGNGWSPHSEVHDVAESAEEIRSADQERAGRAPEEDHRRGRWTSRSGRQDRQRVGKGAEGHQPPPGTLDGLRTNWRSPAASIPHMHRHHDPLHDDAYSGEPPAAARVA